MTNYKTLTYPVEVVREEDGIVVAYHPDLLGCVAQGESVDEALANLDEARVAWLEVRLEEHLPIPEPSDETARRQIREKADEALGGAALGLREALELLKSLDAPVGPIETMIEESVTGRYS